MMPTLIFEGRIVRQIPEATTALSLAPESSPEAIQEWINHNRGQLNVIDVYVEHLLTLKNITAEIIDELYALVAYETAKVDKYFTKHKVFLDHPLVSENVLLTVLEIFGPGSHDEREVLYHLVTEVAVNKEFTLPQKVIDNLVTRKISRRLAGSIARLRNFDVSRLVQLCENVTSETAASRVYVMSNFIASHTFEQLIAADITDYFVDVLLTHSEEINDFKIVDYYGEGSKVVRLLDLYVAKHAGSVIVDITPREMIATYALGIWREQKLLNAQK